MALRIKKTAKQPRAAHLNAVPPAAPTNDPQRPASSRVQSGMVQEQIARLQQRQMEMVQQTALELEELKRQLERNEETEWLRRRVNELEEEKALLQGSFEQQLSSLRNVIRGQARAIDQQIQLFSLDASQNLESLLGALQIDVPRPAAPTRLERPTYLQNTPQPTPPPAFAPTYSLEPPVSEAPTFEEFTEMPVENRSTLETPAFLTDVTSPKQAKKRKKFRLIPGKRLVIRMAVLALFGSVGYWGYNQFLVPKTEIHTPGQVAGVSTSTQAVEDPYAASFADYPFDQTAWENHVDTDFGLSIDWPSNTSNRVRVIGGNNLWFLRKNGFLLKITRLDSGTSLDLETWWYHNKTEYEDQGKVSKTTLKGQPAMYVEAVAITPTSGSSYFIKRPSGIFHIWVKNEPASTDDGQRITKMLDSLTFN